MNAMAAAPMDFSALAQSYLAANPAPAAPVAAASSVGDGAINLAVGAAEVGSAAVIMGYLNARSPSEDKTYHELFGYPTDVVLGLGGVGLGVILALFGRKAYGHVLRVGFGCLLEAGVRMGLEKGVADRDEDKKLEAQKGKKAELRLVEAKQASARTDLSKTADSVFQHVK